MHKQILFVDDEPKVLQGLRRMLRSLRHEWNMEFAEGGAAALECLAAAPFDVLVTDMRMPGMDGAQLLEQVMTRFPSTVRIILSGQCDRQSVLKSVGPAHQFLSKPCDSDILKQTVARACDLRESIVDGELAGRVSRMSAVPTRPSAYAELVTELESEEPSIRRVGEIISRDIGMAAKSLQLVSSSFFGMPQRVSDPAQAVNLLGLDIVTPLALTTDAFAPFDPDGVDRGKLERQVDHCLAVGSAARAVAKAQAQNQAVIDDSFLAGFFHEIGELIVPQAASGADPAVWDVGESTISGIHANAGAYLLTLWGLPESIGTAVALQRFPNRSSDQQFTPTTALHVADAILHEDGTSTSETETGLNLDYLTRIGCADRLDMWREICHAAMPQGVPR